MSYTFWHSGILIGVSNLAESGDPGQRGGVFQPTAHGLEIFPRLTGILSAGRELSAHLDARGEAIDEMDPDQIMELMSNSAGGRKILDLGEMLSKVEVRAPDGTRLEVESIGFTDLAELQGLTREIELDGEGDITGLPPDAPRHLVSATFQEGGYKPTPLAPAYP